MSIFNDPIGAGSIETRPLSPADQARWDSLVASINNTAGAPPPGRTLSSAPLAPRVDDEFIGTDIGAGPAELGDPGPAAPMALENAWHQFDLDRKPGGRFFNAPPSVIAEHEALLRVVAGERPAVRTPDEVLRQQVDACFELVCDITPEQADVLDAQMNKVTDDEVPHYQQLARDALGPEEYTRAIIAGKRILGEEAMKDGRVAGNAYALKILSAVDQARARRDAARADPVGYLRTRRRAR